MLTRDRQANDFAPPPGGKAAIVVCERQPRWAIAARQLLPSVEVVETRSLDDAWHELHQAPYGLLIVDAEAKPAPQLVALLLRVQTELPHAKSIAGVARTSVEWELLLREAGASMVLHAPYRLAGLKAWLERHLARTPPRTTNIRERIWSRLPWPETAPTGASSGA